MKTLLDFRIPASEKAKNPENESHECEKKKTPAKKGHSLGSTKTLKDFGQPKSRKGDLNRTPQDRIDQEPYSLEIREHHPFTEDNHHSRCNSPDVRDYLGALRTYPVHPDDCETNDLFNDQDLLIEMILSGGFSDPRNPPSPLQFYLINSLFYKTQKTVVPRDFIWDTAENYALAMLYSMSGLVVCGSMYLENAVYYMGCLVECGLIDPKLIERELFEAGFGLCVEEIFDQEYIQDIEDDIRRTRRIINKNMQLGSQVWRSDRRYRSFRILKPRQPNPHIDAVLNI